MRIARHWWLAFVLLPIVMLTLVQPARSNTTGTWMGTVVYINNAHIGVKAQGQTRDFILSSDTGFFQNGKKIHRGDVNNGTLVDVSYNSSTLFGSTHATRVDVKTFLVPAAAPTATPY